MNRNKGKEAEQAAGRSLEFLVPRSALGWSWERARTGSAASARAFLRLCRRAALDLIFPPACLSCRAATDAPDSLCPSCWGQARFIERPYCERLGTPFAVDLGAEGLLSPEAVADPPVYGRARAVARFEDGPIRRLVHRLKYNDRLELARPLGAWMARAGTEILAEADLLVPIPLHRRRLFLRGFNQANALAQGVSAASGVPVDPFVLARVKATPSQVGLSRTQRAINLQGAFRVPAERMARVEGRSIILVDDVLTSGATVNAASRALLRAGARQVDVLVFARVV
ncbi:ComF family protein [Methylocapsa acidiphila]|uniref:ComF family protein n=1 Tax=Methylocapsa acidiphila TaxID=133552 RepID=UPI00041617E2|nr:ComF family protein [Methylocapsa acidiphila]